MTRYRVPCADELAAKIDEMVMPDGFRVLEVQRAQSNPLVDPLAYYAAVAHLLVEDDDAPPEFEGKRVEVTISLIDGEPVVTDRRVA